MKLLKHPKMTDVAMLVCSQQDIPGTQTYRLSIKWFNITFQNGPQYTGIHEILKMSISKYLEFEEYKC